MFAPSFNKSGCVARLSLEAYDSLVERGQGDTPEMVPLGSFSTSDCRSFQQLQSQHGRRFSLLLP